MEIFKIENFILEYVLNSSKSIPTKKIFILTIFRPMRLIFLKNTSMFPWKVLRGNFETEISILEYVLSHSESNLTKRLRKNILSLPFFDQELSKWGYLKIFGQKYFFNKIFVPSFSTCHCCSFEPSYTSAPLAFTGISKWVYPHLLPYHQEFMSLLRDRPDNKNRHRR